MPMKWLFRLLNPFCKLSNFLLRYKYTAIMKKLQPVMKKRTTRFVSHRVSTLRYADDIVVIEEGRITQRGSHDELITQPGYYSELNTMQQIEEQLEADS